MSFMNKPSVGNNDTTNSTGVDEKPLETTVEGSVESISGSAEVSSESVAVSAVNTDQESAFGAKKKGFFDMFKKKKRAAPVEPSFEDVNTDGHITETGAEENMDMHSERSMHSETAPAAIDDSRGAMSDVFERSSAVEDESVDANAIASDREEEIIIEIGQKPKALPFIGKMPAKTQYAIGFGLLLASVALAGGMATSGFLTSSQYQSRSEVGTRIQMLTQRMMATTQYAVKGSTEALARLKTSRTDMDVQLDALLKGSDTVKAMSLDDSANLGAIYTSLTKDINPMIDQVIAISASLESLNSNATTLDNAALAIFVSSEQLLALLQSNGAPEIQVSAADHIRILAERMRRNGATLLTSNVTSIEPLADFGSDLRSLRTTIDALSKGDAAVGVPAVTDPSALAVLASMAPDTTKVIKVFGFIEKNASALVTARSNLLALGVKSEDALQSSSAFTAEMSSISASAYGTIYMSIIFVLTALCSLALIGLVNNRSTRMDAWDSVFKNKRNEKDIIDFMEAILPLEMGDLTVRFNQDMQAMEGVTGSIRSSVNEAVISLNDAVGTVKQTTEDVSGAVSQSVESSTAMKHSNERQSLEITDVESRVASLTQAIGKVTDRTVDAARMTESARSASKEGADVVAQTNEKMSVIRANMQDVLKSVKHLGETSHEIGEIVNTIEQITDRTQVLAVNASLEASKAGAAGAGFQIIAGEVNRLAEQSADALRTITALVQRVQGETAVTIRVVEESTNNVVEGARLSEVANTQLETISSLAIELSSIMEEIRSQSTDQSSNAKEVAVSMGRLSKLSVELQSQVSQVVGGVQQIDQSMGSLRNTVSIFTT